MLIAAAKGLHLGILIEFSILQIRKVILIWTPILSSWEYLSVCTLAIDGCHRSFCQSDDQNKMGSLLFFTFIYCIASEVECHFTCFIHFYFYLFFEICLFNSFLKGIFENCIAMAEFLYYLIIRILSLGNLKQISSLLTFNQIYL